MCADVSTRLFVRGLFHALSRKRARATNPLEDVGCWGAMSWILLVGAALNLGGAAVLIFEPRATNGEYTLFKWFTAGTATVFGCLYLFLYWHTS